jgi:anaerobic selenocysteine-containing dehydrogenase
MCGGQSGILAHVVNGVVDKVEPNHWNPNNYSNLSTDFFDGYDEKFGCREGGSLCPKGNAGIMQLYDPDRVKRPLKRTNPDKSLDADPKWQEISWDQALDEIAAKMKALRDGGEAHKLLWFHEDFSFVDIQQDFAKLYGTPNISMHSNLCDVSRKASFKSVMGDDRPNADFLQAKYILLFGWNPTAAAWLAAKPDANGKPISALPEYRPRDWQPSKDFPLFLINWKEASHTHTRTQNNAYLLEIKPTNPLVIHPDTAARYGVNDGDRVSTRISVRHRARDREALPTDPHRGRGTTARLRTPGVGTPRKRARHERFVAASDPIGSNLRSGLAQGDLRPHHAGIAA